MTATIIAVVGSKNSGKTTTITTLTKEFTKRGYTVTAVKHIPESNFTIDHAGKDTWLFAQAGAKTCISVASNEIATIEKINTTSFSLQEILTRCQDNDLIFLEGFKPLVSKDTKIPKIVTVKSRHEAMKAQNSFKPILAFTGPYSTENQKFQIPYINLWKNYAKIVDLIEQIILRKHTA